MDEVYQFLKDARTFYIATCDADQPRVRPFGFVMKYKGRLYFCTGWSKPFAQQMKRNPRFEICACNENAQWLRLSGTGIFEDDLAAKQQAFAEAPGVAALYQSPENPNFALFYLSQGIAQFCSFTAPTRTIAL